MNVEITLANYMGRSSLIFGQNGIAEHKQECFEKIQEVKESHDLFWGHYKEGQKAKATQYREKVQTKLEKNREKLQAAIEALERHRQRADELREKTQESNSRKWQEIFETRLSEAESKIEDIETSITRIEGWIEEDERKLRNLSD